MQMPMQDCTHISMLSIKPRNAIFFSLIVDHHQGIDGPLFLRDLIVVAVGIEKVLEVIAVR